MTKMKWALCAVLLLLGAACEEEGDNGPTPYDAGPRLVLPSCTDFVAVKDAEAQLGVDDLMEPAFQFEPDGPTFACDFGGAVRLMFRLDYAIQTVADLAPDDDGGSAEVQVLDDLGDGGCSFEDGQRRVTRALVVGLCTLEIASDGASVDAHESLLRDALKQFGD